MNNVLVVKLYLPFILVSLLVSSCLTVPLNGVQENFEEIKLMSNKTHRFNLKFEFHIWAEDGEKKVLPKEFTTEILEDLKKEAAKYSIYFSLEKDFDLPTLDIVLSAIEGECSIMGQANFCAVTSLAGWATLGLVPVSSDTVFEANANLLKNQKIITKFLTKESMRTWVHSFLLPVGIYELFARKDRAVKQRVLRKLFSKIEKFKRFEKMP